MNYVDWLIIGALILMTYLGLRRGFLRTTVGLIGFVLVIVVSFYLKNPLATIMYEKLPFFNLGGLLKGVTVINILVYEAIAFIIVTIVLGILYRFIVSLTNILDKVFEFFIFVGIPSKILGGIVGFIEGIVLSFVVMFVSLQFNYCVNEINNSKYGSVILDKTPILSDVISDVYGVVKEIYTLRDKYPNNDEFNRVAFDLLLKNKILSVDSAKVLIESDKLKIDGAKAIVRKYDNDSESNDDESENKDDESTSLQQ